MLSRFRSSCPESIRGRSSNHLRIGTNELECKCFGQHTRPRVLVSVPSPKRTLQTNESGCNGCETTARLSNKEFRKDEEKRRMGKGGSTLNFFLSLGCAPRGGDAFPFRRQASKIVGDSGEIAIDRDGTATGCVSCRVFQRGGQFFLLFFQRSDFLLEFVHPLFFFAPYLGNRIPRFRFQ